MKNLSLVAIISLMAVNLLLCQAYVINDYSIDIDINTDGTFRVHEIISVNFSEKRRGIFRNIPRSFSIDGKVVKTNLKNVEVKNHKFKLLKEGNENVIRIGEKNTFLTGQQTYDFSYVIENAFLFESDHIALQYNLISDWDTEIKQMNYNINLPSNLDLDQNEYRIFTGKIGAQNRHTNIQKIGRRIYGTSLSPIPAKENVTIAIKLPIDYITKPVPPPPPVPLLQRDKLWLLPIAFLTALLGFFFKKRKTEVYTDIEDLFYPPEDFSPAQVGAYHDNKVNTEDLIALLPYWAHKGYINISSGTEGNLFFKKLSPLPVNEEDYQKIIFENIFKTEDIVMLSELNEKMYTTISKAKGKIHSTLLDKSLYDEESYRLFHTGKMIFLAFLSIALGLFLIIKFGLVITGVICFAFGITAFTIHFLKPKESNKGAIFKLKLERLKAFLQNGDANKTAELIKENPSYFEELFPYAIALGVDKDWTARMESLEVTVPHYYNSPILSNHSTQNVGSFSKAFDVPKIKSVFTSYPATQSSSGGGFSGGSGAGGGFGGGGGSW